MIQTKEADLRNEAESCVGELTKMSRLFNMSAEDVVPKFEPDGKEISVYK